MQSAALPLFQNDVSQVFYQTSQFPSTATICSSICPWRKEFINTPENGSNFTQFLEDLSEVRKKRNCWHICYFKEVNENAHLDPGVQEIAYRLNEIMIKIFTPNGAGFNYSQFNEFIHEQIEFFKSHYDREIDFLNGSRVSLGPTIFFHKKGGSFPMGIQEKHARIIQQMLALDCSHRAQKAFLLLRASNFQNDTVVLENQPHSLSYGSSLFAGCMLDGGATPIHLIRDRSSPDLSILTVPFDQYHQCPFYIPNTNAIVQLFSFGEHFHGKSKIWQGADTEMLTGIFDRNPTRIRYLQTQLPKDVFIAEFERYKREAKLIIFK